MRRGKRGGEKKGRGEEMEKGGESEGGRGGRLYIGKRVCMSHVDI